MNLPFDQTRRRRIHLMRHGDVAYFNAAGQKVNDSRVVVLTEKGRDEAAGMRDMLSAIAFDKAICSGLPRTVETAKIVLCGRSVPLDYVSDLEEIRGGDAVARAKLSPPEYAYSMFHAGIDGACYAHGEAFRDFYNRTTTAFRSIVADAAWTSLLLVAHGGVNRSILGHATGAGLSGFGSFEQDTCCVNIIDVDTALDDGRVVRYIVRAVNVTHDDPAKAGRPLTAMEKYALTAFPNLRSPS